MELGSYFLFLQEQIKDIILNQNADQLGSLAGPPLLTVYVGVEECAPSSLPPASSSLTHARRMDGFCNPNFGRSRTGKGSSGGRKKGVG